MQLAAPRRGAWICNTAGFAGQLRTPGGTKGTADDRGTSRTFPQSQPCLRHGVGWLRAVHPPPPQLAALARRRLAARTANDPEARLGSFVRQGEDVGMLTGRGEGPTPLSCLRRCVTGVAAPPSRQHGWGRKEGRSRGGSEGGRSGKVPGPSGMQWVERCPRGRLSELVQTGGWDASPV